MPVVHKDLPRPPNLPHLFLAAVLVGALVGALVGTPEMEARLQAEVPQPVAGVSDRRIKVNHLRLLQVQMEARMPRRRTAEARRDRLPAGSRRMGTTALKRVVQAHRIGTRCRCLRRSQEAVVLASPQPRLPPKTAADRAYLLHLPTANAAMEFRGALAGVALQ